MEPVFMMLGHAAGAAASLAIEHHVTVQNVPYAPLRERLLAGKQILERAAPGAKPAAIADPSSPTAPDSQLLADVKVLVEKKIVDSPDYWLANAAKGKQCDGKMVEPLLLNMARAFEPANTRAESLRVLVARKILASPAYWEERATAGRMCAGDSVRTVIRNFVRAAQ